MRRLAGLCASIIGVGALVGVLLAQGPADDVARAQTGMPAAPSAPGAAGTGAMMGGGMMGGGMMGMGGAAATDAAPAAPTVTVTRQVKDDLAEGDDVVVDVVNGATLQLQNGVDGQVFVRLDGVVLPRESVRLRSDWTKVEGTGDPWDWRRFDGALYKDATIPDIETYRKGEDELRAFVMDTVVNRTVTVEKVGDFLQANGKTIPAVKITYTRPEILIGQDTSPFDLNAEVIAKTKALGLWNCMWDRGKPKAFDCSTQRWAN